MVLLVGAFAGLTAMLFLYTPRPILAAGVLATVAIALAVASRMLFQHERLVLFAIGPTSLAVAAALAALSIRALLRARPTPPAG